MLQEDYTKAQPKTKPFLTEIKFLQYEQGQNETTALICIGLTKTDEK